MEAKAFLYQRVSVRSFGSTSTEFGDEGILRSITEQFVVLENTKGELLLFPTRNVRLIKMLDRNVV